MSYLLVIAFILAAAWFYSGFARQSEGKRGALAVFLVLGALTVVIFDRASADIQAVDEWVAPYVEEVAAVETPPLPSEIDKALSIKASEGGEESGSFYVRKQAQAGWSAVGGLPLLTVRHEEREQVLTIKENPTTLLTYELKDVPAGD